MAAIFLLLIIFAILGPIGAIIRAIVYVNRASDYTYATEPGPKFFSVVHDISVMIIIPLTYFLSMGTVRVGINGYFFTLIQWAMVLAVVVYYFFFKIEKELRPPLTEITGLFLFGLGIALNFYLSLEYFFASDGSLLFLFAIGHLPVIILCTLMIYRRHRLFMLATQRETIVNPQLDDLLDYLPERNEAGSYAVTHDGLHGLLWLEGWQKLLLSVAIGSGILLVFDQAQNYFFPVVY